MPKFEAGYCVRFNFQIMNCNLLIIVGLNGSESDVRNVCEDPM